MGATVSILTVKKVLLTNTDCGALTATDVEEAITSLIEAVPAGMQEDAPPLIAAAAVGDRKMVEMLVQSGDGLNATNSSGLTPIHWAVSVDEESEIRSLLALDEHAAANGATTVNLDATDANGFTALHYATVTCKSFMAHVLLSAGASVDCRDVGGQTPLMKAAKRNDVALCRVLLDAGADVAATDVIGQTALHEAAAAGGLTTRLLVGRGAATAVVDGQGRLPLHCALRHSRLDAARALLPTAAFTPHTDETGRTELHWAAANGTADIVECLLKFGPCRWPRDSEGMTPLMLALETRNVQAVEVLLDSAGRCEGVANRAGSTALHLAARAGLAGVLRRLLQRGCDAWRPDPEGRDALMLAVLSGDEEAVAAVLRHAGFRQYADRHGRTALHMAVASGNAGVVLNLLQHGADPDTVDLAGWTPLATAYHFDLPAVVEVLQCFPGQKTRCTKRE